MPAVRKKPGQSGKKNSLLLCQQCGIGFGVWAGRERRKGPSESKGIGKFHDDPTREERKTQANLRETSKPVGKVGRGLPKMGTNGLHDS